MKKHKFLLAVLLICISLDIHAFKVNTHVWVAQQVINDLQDDDKISLILGNKEIEIPVSNSVRNAILNYPGIYRMGNIGPDAMPDVVVGQSILHPGNDDSWGANDWANYLLSKYPDNEAAQALAYGYLGHIASDVFSHTYVNQYAGSVFEFDLTGNMYGERRHAALENFISKYTPPLKDHNNIFLGNPWDNVFYSGNYGEYIRGIFIYDPQVQEQYQKGTYASHLIGIYELRKKIDEFAEDPFWDAADAAIVKILASYYFEIVLSDDESEQIVNLAQGVLDVVNETGDKLQVEADKFYERLKKFDNAAFAELESRINTMNQIENELLKAHNELESTIRDIEDYICKKHCFWNNCVYYPPRCDSLLKDKRRLEDSLKESIVKYKADLKKAIRDTREESLKVVESLVTIKHLMVDFKQMTKSDVSPLKSLLKGWREDIDISMAAYTTASSEAIVTTMNPNADPEPMDIMTHWYECYNGRIQGLPSYISGCEFKDAVTQLQESITQIYLIADELTSAGYNIFGLPSKREMEIVKKDLENGLVVFAKDQIKYFLPDGIKKLLDAMGHKDMTDERLNGYFGIKTDPNALIIGDIAQRVKSEMHLKLSGFDPSKYAVVYNAVVLAKLALLNKEGFTTLATLAGSKDYKNYIGINNLVAGAFSNIDGNHCWMPIQPPLINANNNYSDVSDINCTTTSGFILWKDDMRDKLFRKLFIGPLTPGIYSLPASSEYPYDVCKVNPFPDDINDTRCTTIKMLTPIITGLL